MIRGFERLSYIKENIPLPARSTKHSAGYDICVIHPQVFNMLKEGYSVDEAWNIVTKGSRKCRVWKVEGENSIVLPTGIKAYMQDDEYLMMCVRSSAGIKKGLKLANPPSIIDADYYNNPDNEGHIMVAFRNECICFEQPIMRVAQGIFQKYLIADYDNADGDRLGGTGSTKD